MKPVLLPDRPISTSDKRWWISFISASGHRRPDGMTGMCWQAYSVIAGSPDEALNHLRAAKDFPWDRRCDVLSALHQGADIRICKFDLSRRWVIDFDPTGLCRDGHHHYAIVLECIGDDEPDIPTRDQAREARNRDARVQDDCFQRSTREEVRPIDDLPLEIRDLIEIQQGGCWIWQGSTSLGYGTVRHAGRQWQTHRLVFSLLRDEIPPKAILRHLCHSRRCCNPQHLEPGTHFANRADRLVKKDARKLLKKRRVSDNERVHDLRRLHGLRPPSQKDDAT